MPKKQKSVNSRGQITRWSVLAGDCDCPQLEFSPGEAGHPAGVLKPGWENHQSRVEVDPQPADSQRVGAGGQLNTCGTPVVFMIGRAASSKQKASVRLIHLWDMVVNL